MQAINIKKNGVDHVMLALVPVRTPKTSQEAFHAQFELFTMLESFHGQYKLLVIA